MMLAALARGLGTGGSILCLHSLTSPDLPGAGDAHISSAAFGALLDVARACGEIVPLGDLIERHEEGRSTAGLVAITFDDAYAALVPVLSELMMRRPVPVTIFAVSDAADAGRSFWWDRIADLHPLVPEPRWRAFEAACGLPEVFRSGQPREYGPLRPLRQWVLAAFAGRWPAHLEPELSALESEAGCRTRQRSMRVEELASLARMPEISIGVHTVSHPVLPLLPPAEMRSEISGNHAWLRERFDRVLPVLAVPFGLYDARTLAAARAAGMRASLTLSGRQLRPTDRALGLPRFCITQRDNRARTALCVLGIRDLVRERPGSRDRALYPALPSAST